MENIRIKDIERWSEIYSKVSKVNLKNTLEGRQQNKKDYLRLFYYFLYNQNYTDQEIADFVNFHRSTITHHRHKQLDLMSKYPNCLSYYKLIEAKMWEIKAKEDNSIIPENVYVIRRKHD